MKLKSFFPLLVEELVHILLWIYMIRKYPDRFTGNLGIIVIVSLAIAILLSNLFDIVYKCWTTKHRVNDTAEQRVSQPLRYLVVSIVFTSAFLFISKYAPARAVLLIWLGCTSALAYVVVTHVISYLLQLEGSILPVNELLCPYDAEDDEDGT